MSVSYWNLREKPFQNVADSRFAYLSDQHKEALARLLFLVEGHKLGGVLTGPYGVGKSMIIELLFEKIQTMPLVRTVVLDAPPASALALAKQILNRLGVTRSISDLGEALDGIQTLYQDAHQPFLQLVVLIDEAQLIRDPTTFEFLHLLTNIRNRSRNGSSPETVTTIILSGHTDLVKTIRSDASLCQRLTLFCELTPLTEAQVVEYVHHRMRVAGGDIWTFEADALREISHASCGLPRIINNICDIALLAGRAIQAPSISLNVVRMAIQEAHATFNPTTTSENNT